MEHTTCPSITRSHALKSILSLVFLYCRTDKLDTWCFWILHCSSTLKIRSILALCLTLHATTSFEADQQDGPYSMKLCARGCTRYHGCGYPSRGNLKNLGTLGAPTPEHNADKVQRFYYIGLNIQSEQRRWRMRALDSPWVHYIIGKKVEHRRSTPSR